MIQQINHHSPLNPPLLNSSPIPIHFPKTPQFTNSLTPLKSFPLPNLPIAQPNPSTHFPSISLTILETPILPYKSTLFQSTHITLPLPYHFLYIIY